MALYSKIVSGLALGEAADTFENVGTCQLRSDADRLFGFIVGAGVTTLTAAEANHGQIMVTSSDLGLGAQIAGTMPNCGGAIATNDQGTPSYSEFLPLNLKCNGKENIVYDYTTHLADPTAGSDVLVATVFSGRSSPTDLNMLSDMPRMHPFSARGYDSEALGTVTTVAETYIGADLNIPSWASWICGFKCTATTAAVQTAAENIVGYFRFRSTMPDFEPQEWPFLYQYNASLGTPVGQPIFMPYSHFWAHSFPTPRRNESISAYSVLLVASSANLSVAATAAYL